MKLEIKHEFVHYASETTFFEDLSTVEYVDHQSTPLHTIYTRLHTAMAELSSMC
jgi:hypothetical protein